MPPYEYSSTYTNPCGFSTSDSLSPYVDSISPITASGGDTVTIAGDGFSTTASDNFVLFGEIECNVIQATNTSIDCILGNGIVGSKKLWLHVLTNSVAKTNGISLEYIVAVHSMEPSTSGTGGGIELTLAGDGFASISEKVIKSDNIGYTFSGYKSVLPSSCNSWKNKVLVGSEECKITSFSQALVKCVIPPGSEGSVNVELSVYCEDSGSTESYTTIFTDQFTYASALDPTITSISPTTGSGRGGETVTITGTGFPASTDEISVMVSTHSP